MEPQLRRALDRKAVLALLEETRQRTLRLIEPLSEDDLRRQHDPLMSPIIWDLGHIAHFEEVWLVENIDGDVTGSEGLRGVYNPFENPRSVRDDLSLPERDECLDYLARVRETVVRRIQTLDLAADTPLLREGFGFNLVLQHEYQHNETILQTLQLMTRPYPLVPSLSGSDGRPFRPGAEMVFFSGGNVLVGTDDRSRAYDNERPSGVLQVDPFWIDRDPVTNGSFAEFIDDGGYAADSLWSEQGRVWRDGAQTEAPKFWFRREGDWWTQVMGRPFAVNPSLPVCHVCYYEAEAFARWAGKRLPTEVEWEVAAGWDAASGTARTFPWGEEPATSALANLDATRFQASPAGTYQRNVSPLGCYGMIGDVWEWTSSDFLPYAGYETFPYPEYSEVFFGDEYMVLRGGSWATRPGVIRNTFRNWDYPIRRQIFAGFRCARDG